VNQSVKPQAAAALSSRGNLEERAALPLYHWIERWKCLRVSVAAMGERKQFLVPTENLTPTPDETE